MNRIQTTQTKRGSGDSLIIGTLCWAAIGVIIAACFLFENSELLWTR